MINNARNTQKKVLLVASPRVVQVLATMMIAGMHNSWIPGKAGKATKLLMVKTIESIQARPSTSLNINEEVDAINNKRRLKCATRFIKRTSP